MDHLRSPARPGYHPEGHSNAKGDQHRCQRIAFDVGLDFAARRADLGLCFFGRACDLVLGVLDRISGCRAALKRKNLDSDISIG
jgi:hypothetical protein